MDPDDVHAVNEQLQAAYRQTFGTPLGRQVLVDLIAFCHGRTAAIGKRAAGKRDVLLRIQEFINLSMDDIYQLRGFGRTIAHKEDTDG